MNAWRGTGKRPAKRPAGAAWGQQGGGPQGKRRDRAQQGQKPKRRSENPFSEQDERQKELENQDQGQEEELEEQEIAQDDNVDSDTSSVQSVIMVGRV